MSIESFKKRNLTVENTLSEATDEDVIIEFLADIDKDISGITVERTIFNQKESNSKKIHIDQFLEANKREQYANEANDYIDANDSATKLSISGSRAGKDFRFNLEGIEKAIYVKNRPTGKRGAAGDDPHELMTAALCVMSKLPAVEDTDQMDELIEQSRKLVKSGKVVGEKSGQFDAMAKDYQNFIMAYSAAKTIHDKGYGGADKAYLTGQAWDSEVTQFQMTKHGMKDFNSSDFILKKGNNYLGVSLKKKDSINKSDPTLFNPAFDTLLKGDKDMEKLRIEMELQRSFFYSRMLLNKDILQHITSATMRKRLEDVQKQLTPLSKSKYRKLLVGDPKKRGAPWKKFIQSIPNDYINKQLKGTAGAGNRQIFKDIMNTLIKYENVFADRILNLVFRTDLKQLQKVNFDFALVTGVGRMLKNGEIKDVEGGKYEDIDTTTTRINDLVKKGKPKLIATPGKVQAFEENATAAVVYGSLMLGGMPVINLEVRYKGNFQSSPSIQGVMTKEFKSLYESVAVQTFKETTMDLEERELKELFGSVPFPIDTIAWQAKNKGGTPKGSGKWTFDFKVPVRTPGAMYLDDGEFTFKGMFKKAVQALVKYLKRSAGPKGNLKQAKVKLKP